MYIKKKTENTPFIVTPTGLEPVLIALKGRGFGQLIYGAFFFLISCIGFIFVFLFRERVMIIRILFISPGCR